MTIKAVFFDFGGVLYQTPNQKWLRRWLKWFGIEENSDLAGLVFSREDSPYFQAVMKGRITEEEVWSLMSASSQVSPLILKWLRRHTFSRRRLNREVADFLESLRPRFKTGIISNIGSDGRQVLLKVFHFDRLVDTMVLSAEEGVMKPEARIYTIALQRLGVSAPEALFLDDLFINVTAARKLGMNAVHFCDTRQALAEVASLLNGHRL